MPHQGLVYHKVPLRPIECDVIKSCDDGKGRVSQWPNGLEAIPAKRPKIPNQRGPNQRANQCG